MDQLKQTYDAIVVGTGAGGATVAKELADRGWRVLILEWGSYRPITGTTLNALPQIALPGRGLLLTPDLYGIGRGITTGGSTIFYYATSMDPPLDMLKSYGIDVTQELKETKEELPISPLPDEWIPPISWRIMESAQELGLDWGKLDKFIYHDRLREVERGGWGWIGAPNYEAKWNARMYIDQAIKKDAQIINRAKVTRVLIEGGRGIGVQFRRLGKRYQAYGERVILSAGGIGSAVILRASGIQEAGYDFFFDPLITAMGTVKDLKVSPMIPMSTGVLCEEEEYLLTDMYYPPLLFFLNHLAGFRIHRVLAEARTAQIMVKIKDSLGGRLTDGGGVRKTLSSQDRKKLHNGYERAKKILQRAGARDIFWGWVIAAHPGGTAKVNQLLDSNLRTRFDRLYVCDCSVIPEAWGLPPVLTLVCLGKRLAKHLSGGKPASAL